MHRLSKKLGIIINLLLLTLISSTSYAKNVIHYSCSPKNSTAIDAVITHYVNKSTAVPESDIKISAKKCVGKYASAIIHLRKPITDDATVYLHKEKNMWVVLSLGTYFDEKFLSKIPKEIQNK